MSEASEVAGQLRELHDQPEVTEPPLPVTPAVLRRHDALAVAALVLISSLFFADVLVGTANFYKRDLARYYYPTKKVVREIVLGGEFPYWNRLFSAGQPIAANPEHEVFYPLTWLLFLPNYDFGYRLHILVHVWIGLAGMYALLRSMELRPPAAFFGAIAFGLGGLYLSYINLLPILFCAAWLPLTCLHVRRFLFERRARSFALAALFLGLQFLVAEPTTVMQTGFLIGMYALYRGWYSSSRLRSMTVNVFYIAMISTAAFAVGAAQMLSAIDHVRDSIRGRGFDFERVGAWSMPWAKLAEWIYPNILGHISIGKAMWYWGALIYGESMGSPFIYSIYPGLAVTGLVIGGALIRPRGARFVLILTLFSSVIALGSNTPLLKWLYDAGIASTIRYPEKFILIAVFALTIFAAQMLQRLLDGDNRLRAATAGFALATAVIAIALAALSNTRPGTEIFLEVWGLERNSGSLFMARLAGNDWIVAAVRGFLLVALVLLVGIRRRVMWLAGAAMFLFADLLPVVLELNPRVPATFFTEPPAVAAALPPNHQDYRVFHEAAWNTLTGTTGRYFLKTSTSHWVSRNGLFPMITAGQGIALVLESDYDQTSLLPTVDLVNAMWDLRRAGREDWAELMMSMSNAWYRGVPRDFDQEQLRTKGDFREIRPIEFMERPHYPRYYFADEVVRVRDAKEFVRRLTDGPRGRPAPRAFIHEPAFTPAPGRVLRQNETANDAIIDVESSGRGFLVMSVTPHKYWRIFIDGLEVRSLVTNIGYQGVIVPPGRHRVTMRYRNTLIRTGVIISMGTTLVLLAVAFSSSRRAGDGVMMPGARA